MGRTLPPYYRRIEQAVWQQGGQQRGRGAERRADSQFLFHADDFALRLQDGWQNETVYVLEGPVEDDLQHTIQINVDPNAGGIAVIDYADMQIEGQKSTLRGCRLLMKRFTQLDNEMRAYRAIFDWYPTEERRVYQDHFYVVYDDIGYRLTANFTKKTRKTLGPKVERAFRSFDPHLPLRSRR